MCLLADSPHVHVNGALNPVQLQSMNKYIDDIYSTIENVYFFDICKVGVCHVYQVNVYNDSWDHLYQMHLQRIRMIHNDNLVGDMKLE